MSLEGRKCLGARLGKIIFICDHLRARAIYGKSSSGKLIFGAHFGAWLSPPRDWSPPMLVHAIFDTVKCCNNSLNVNAALLLSTLRKQITFKVSAIRRKTQLKRLIYSKSN
jgi:hypothetical protein